MILTRTTIHIYVVGQCLLCYAVESTVVRSDYELPNLNLFKIKVLFALLLKRMITYISSPSVDNKYVEKLL